MSGSHAHRLAKLMAEAANGLDHVVIESWPGMTHAESFRIWYGPDESRWPGRLTKVIFLVNGPLVSRFHEEIGGGGEPAYFASAGDFPYEMFEKRNDLVFDRWWHILCARADAIRARRVPNGDSSLYQWLEQVGYTDDGGMNRWPRDVPL